MSTGSQPSNPHPSIAIIGPGNVGAALGERFARSGIPVIFGVRPGKDLGELLARTGERASALPVVEAARAAEVIFLAVPGAQAVAVATSLGDVTGKILVDCNNPVGWDAGPVWSPPEAGSLSAAIAQALPGARVIKAFNTFGAEFHGDPMVGDTAVDVYMAGDDTEAKQTLAGIIRTAGFTPVDAGPSRNAAVLENLAILWIHLALVGGQGRDFAFKMLRRA